MNITNQQEAEKFVLSYLESNQEFLFKVILPKFSLKKVGRKKKLPMVDAETDKRIGEALAEIKAGNYIQLNSPTEIEQHFRGLFQKNDLQD